MRRSIHVGILIAALAALIGSSVGAAMAASTRPSTDDATAGVVVEPIKAQATGGRVTLSPVRFDPVKALPGASLRYPLRVRNTLPVDVVLSTYTIALEGSSDPGTYATPTGTRSRSHDAVAWVTYPGFGPRRTLASGSELRFDALMNVPRDAVPGTYAVGLTVTQRVSAPGTNLVDGAASRVQLAVDLASIAVVRVPGDAKAEARLRSVDAPRVVWRDRSPEFRARVVNAGDTDLVIDGKVDLNAFLATAGRRLDAQGPEKGQPTLPGGVRDVRMRWSDPPLVGWFQPTLVIVGGTGSDVRIEKQLDTVWVLPPWWLMLAIVLAIVLPLWMRRRRRRNPAFQQARRARAHERVEARLKRDEARRRAADARRKR